VEEVVVASLVSFASYIRSTLPTKQNAKRKKRKKQRRKFILLGVRYKVKEREVFSS
jgi:hypothetical protein